MVKRKKSRDSVLVKNPDSSSGSETEKSSKVAKMQKTFSSRYRSTPFNAHSASDYEISTPKDNSASPMFKPSTSNAAERNSFQNTEEISFKGSRNASGGSYKNFASFLQSHSFVEEEDDVLTVSQSAKKRNWTSNGVSESVPEEVNNSCRDVSMDLLHEDTERIFLVVNNFTQLVILQHPSSLILKGYVKMSVLAGIVSVFGYKVREKEHVNVLSNQYAGFQKIITKKCVRKRTFRNLHKTINEIAGKREGVESFLEEIGSSSVVVLIEKSMLPAHLQFVHLYYPHFLGPKTVSYNKDRCNVFEIDSDMETVAAELKKAIDLSDGTDSGPRLLVHGPKNSGKSSMLRYLINTVLNTNFAVYYLDTDPGQTEFTPPGVVSLTQVTKPLLGPPFCNKVEPVKMICTGSDTPATSPPMYLESVLKLIEYFYENFQQEILLVNTIGWIEGIGKNCLQAIKSKLKPTILLEFGPCRELKTESVESVCHIQIPRKSYVGERYPAKSLRIYALMSYFGRCQNFYMQPTYINAFRPVCICWDNIAIYLMRKQVPAYRITEAIHCSIVALCHVDEFVINKNDAGEAVFPLTLKNDPMNECLGFGLVRATDQVNHLLYIVTPLSLKELNSVNAIIKGNTMIPDEVLLKQPILNTPLPFTDQPKTAPAFNRKSVKKRQFKPNQTPKTQ